MRRVASVLLALSLTWLLSACTPGHNAVIAIGYDAQGKLVGAVKVCQLHIVNAELLYAAHATRNTPYSASWHRKTPLAEGIETWSLEEPVAPWAAQSPFRTLGPDGEYQFLASNESDEYRSDILDFHGHDLARLRPGELLVGRPGPPDKEGVPGWAVGVISLEDLPKEPCPS